MIDRNLTDHLRLAGTDYVLEGASVRDRFLTAFVLQHNGWPQVAMLPDRSGPVSWIPLPEAAEESFSGQEESCCEPLTIQVIDGWYGADDDDDME